MTDDQRMAPSPPTSTPFVGPLRDPRGDVVGKPPPSTVTAENDALPGRRAQGGRTRRGGLLRELRTLLTVSSRTKSTEPSAVNTSPSPTIARWTPTKRAAWGSATTRHPVACARRVGGDVRLSGGPPSSGRSRRVDPGPTRRLSRSRYRPTPTTPGLGGTTWLKAAGSRQTATAQSCGPGARPAGGGLVPHCLLPSS